MPATDQAAASGDFNVDNVLARIDADLAYAERILSANGRVWPDAAIDQARQRLAAVRDSAGLIEAPDVAEIADQLDGLLAGMAQARREAEPDVSDAVLRGIDVMLCLSRDTSRRRAGKPAAVLEQAVAQLFARIAGIRRRQTAGVSSVSDATQTRKIAHDLNNLLLIIGGNAEMLTMDLDPSHPGYEQAQAVMQAAQQAAQLTRELLAAGRGQH
jgi:signal transduction histidine kinase